jgi:hypothetical protein
MVRIGPMPQEKLYDFECGPCRIGQACLPARRPQRSISVTISSFKICAGSNQRPNNLKVPILGCYVQGRKSVFICSRNIVTTTYLTL